MRDEKGRFLKRVKETLSNSKPATLEALVDVRPEQQEFMEMKDVFVNVVPTKQHSAQQRARRSNIMSATVTIIGNLTADPELRATNSGKSVINFALAYTPRRPDGSDGPTSFYNVTAWEYLADNFAASFKKGDRLVVVGRLSQDKWNDKETDKQMSRLVITAEEIGGTCRFHTVEMSKVQRAQKVEENVETDAEQSDIFA